MISNISDKIKILETDLKLIDIENPDILKKSEKTIFCIKASLKQIKEYICQNQFSSQEEEIQFFKEIKPSVYSKLIYFVKIFNIESKRPNGSDKFQKKYLLNELSKLEKYFSENLEFYQYMRNNMTYLDDKYFVRGKLDLRLYVNTFIYDADPIFSTSHDYKASKILANDLLNIYLNSELSILERKDGSAGKNMLIAKGKYSWTESKIALIELIYALHSARCINNGNIEIKELAAFMESLFKIDLGDYYRDYLQIKNRQNQTRFIDNLKTTFVKRINEQDE
ncbi:MAG TPA: tetracycline regulation of excision, RteC [Marinilabiliales bacterium]|nr:tetracycline regulation of excision, RteC [Marinilabiliales bacterium]